MTCSRLDSSIMKLLGLRAGGRTSSKEGFVTKTLLDHPRLWGCAPYPPALEHALPRAAANSRIRPKTLRPVPPMATTGHERDGGINLELQSANSYVVPLKKGIHSFKNTASFPAVSDSSTPAIPLALSLSKGLERNSDPVLPKNKQVLIQYIRGHFVDPGALPGMRGKLLSTL